MIEKKIINGVTINIASGDGWRLVHDNTEVKELVEGTANDHTNSIYNIEEFPTKEEAIQRIADLNLIYNDDNF